MFLFAVYSRVQEILGFSITNLDNKTGSFSELRAVKDCPLCYNIINIFESGSVMNINIITVGRIKEKYIQEGIKEFSKRLSRYCNLKIVEVDDEKAPESLSDKEMEVVKQKEGQKILSKIPQNSFIISLEIQGKEISSEDLSKKMEDVMVSGINDITFIIGGSLGLSDEVRNISDFKLSFSKMTFPHQLMRLILLEQIYRGWRIMKNEPYHK